MAGLSSTLVVRVAPRARQEPLLMDAMQMGALLFAEAAKLLKLLARHLQEN